jgi:hypothetical protein
MAWRPAHAEKWVLVKASRGYGGGIGYTGPSWEAAGLPIPTRPFDTWAEAQCAREALDEVNTVGWVIRSYRPADIGNSPQTPGGDAGASSATSEQVGQ